MSDLVEMAEGTAAGKQRKLMIALVWLVFVAGLALQAFSPHLTVEHNTFVVSSDSVPAGSVIDPRSLVQRERYFQAASAALVLIGALGLAFAYREVLRRSFSGR